jgi:hypothetical protein
MVAEALALAPARERAGMRDGVLAVLVAAVVVSLGAAGGGYFPSSWGWLELLVLVVAVWAIAGGGIAVPTRGEAVFLGAFVLLAALAARSDVNEAARTVLYVTSAAVTAMVVRRRSAFSVPVGILGGATAIAAYSLGTRLFPDRIGTFDSIARYRLSTPIGYWNALGLLCALAVLLAVALAASADTPLRAAAAGVTVPPAAAALYFTFSRGSWLALAIGLAVGIALDPRRLRLSTFAAALAAPAGIAVWLGSRSSALTHQHATLARAAHDGHRLAAIVVCLAVLAGALAAVLTFARRRVALPAAAQRGYAALLFAAALVAIGAALARADGPAGLAARAWNSFAAAPPQTQVDLRKRLFSFSGNGRADLFRAALDDGRAHPLLGSGAGSYESYWLANRSSVLKVRDAHSLYLETFAELGIVGLILLVVALGAPLVAAIGARRRPGVAAIAGAYVAYLVHAGFDWDWEVPAVTLAALLTGVALLAFARSEDDERRTISPRARNVLLAGAAVVGTSAFVFLVGQMQLSRAAAAADSARWTQAEAAARSASHWLPWSTEPERRLGEAQLAQGQRTAARVSFGKALSKDDGDWSLWLDLARASTGKVQAVALAHASRLNPRSPEIAELDAELGGIDIGVGK